MGKKLDSELKGKIEKLLLQKAGTPKLDQIVSDETGVPFETIRAIRKRLGVKAGKTGRPKKDKSSTLPKPADDLTRDDRFKRLRVKMQGDPKYKVLAEILDKKERDMFLSEFTSIAIDMETLDSFEEAHLYTAIINFVLGTRYARRYQQERDAYERFINSEFFGAPNINPATLPRSMRSLPPDENLMDEFHKSVDTFNKIRDKFARIQEEKRKRIIGGKKTFMDYLAYYNDRDKQDEARMEISDIAKLNDDELKRMVDSGELEGWFDRK